MRRGRPAEPLPHARALRADDADAARALVAAAFGGTPYAARMREVLEEALAGAGDEARGVVIDAASGIAGVAVHGAIAGAEGAARLHFAATRSAANAASADDVVARLLGAVTAAATSAGARFLAAELPDDPAFAPLAAALHAQGFAEEGRIADYVRDGVALRLLRLTIRTGRA